MIPRSVRRLLLLSFLLPSFASGAEWAVINDPDGFTNVRAAQDTKSAIVARVKAGEPFTFDYRGGTFAEWVKVTLKSGKTGWMHASRVQRTASLSALADRAPGDEANIAAKRAGFDYYPVARAAARGEPAAMQRYFTFRGDGAAAETHNELVGTVMELIGDEKLARFLSELPAAQRTDLRTMIEEGNTFWPFEPRGYLQRNFPKSAKVLLRP